MNFYTNLIIKTCKKICHLKIFFKFGKYLHDYNKYNQYFCFSLFLKYNIFYYLKAYYINNVNEFINIETY